MKTFPLCLFFVISISTWSQNDSSYYETGELHRYSYQNQKGQDTFELFFYKSGKLKAEQFFDSQGTLTYNYLLDENGDTLSTSFIPAFNAQPQKDLSFITWKSTTNGAFYNIENQGNGGKLTNGRTISLWYIGYFLDGKQFDNSDITGNVLSITLGDGKYLKSLEEGLMYFNIGGVGYIKIPHRLGYGSKPYSNIPPNSTLIYYVKILE